MSAQTLLVEKGHGEYSSCASITVIIAVLLIHQAYNKLGYILKK